MIHRDKKAGKRTPSGTRTKIYLRELHVTPIKKLMVTKPSEKN